jgi:hypothetical protein
MNYHIAMGCQGDYVAIGRTRTRGYAARLEGHSMEDIIVVRHSIHRFHLLP